MTGDMNNSTSPAQVDSSLQAPVGCIPILVTGKDEDGNEWTGWLTGNGGGRFTGMVNEWGKHVAVLKRSVRAAPNTD